MNGICLTNLRWGHAYFDIPQIAEEASFFSVTLLRAWFYDKEFCKIVFNLLKIFGGVAGTYSCYVSKVAVIYSSI